MTEERDEASVFLFVWKRVTTYSGNETGGKMSLKELYVAAISFDVTSDSSLSRIPCGFLCVLMSAFLQNRSLTCDIPLCLAMF